jgi:starch-binding outer membrane protein, SusD/RagB family
LIRQGMTKATAELTVKGDMGTFYTGNSAVYDVQFDAGTRGFLPIPQVEIDLSAGVLVQNKGY